MAHRSQCSSAGDNPLDPNYLPPHYREEYRLAVDILVEEDLEGYYHFLKRADVVDFLCSQEIGYIQSAVQVPHEGNYGDKQRCLPDSEGDSSSDTYWPVHSDLDAPDLDLGWPQLNRFIGPTEVTTLVNPAEHDMPSIKEQARRLIRTSQQVVAIVMDMFTDVDIFAEILDAAMRNVAVYILLDELNAHHFVNMLSNCRVNLASIQSLRVRTVSGISYQCRSGKMLKGQMMDRFLLTDCRAVLSGNYSFMWSFEKLHRCLAHLFLGQLVSTFDEEFRILYAQSQPLTLDKLHAPVEGFVPLPERQYLTDRSALIRESRKYATVDNPGPDERPRHNFEERMDKDWKNMPHNRHESTQGAVDMYKNPTQQLRIGQTYDQSSSRMPSNMMEGPNFKRHSYAEGRQTSYLPMQQPGMPHFESQGRRMDAVYSAYDRFKSHAHPPVDQNPEPDLPYEMEPPENFDLVLNYLSSTSNAEDQMSDNFNPPAELSSGSSRPRRLSLGKPQAYESAPSPPNQPEQTQILQASNMDRKDPAVRQGLRNWRINSYLSTFDNAGDEEMPLPTHQASDPFNETPNPSYNTVSGPDSSTTKFPNTSEFKAAPRPFPSYRKSNVLAPSENYPEDFLTLPAQAKLTPSTSESSLTEADKTDEMEQQEPKDVQPEESFRRRYNATVQRSSRLRSSLIFSSQLEQPVPQDIRTTTGKHDKDTDKAEGTESKLPFALHVLGHRKTFAKEPFEWSRFVRSATIDSSLTELSKSDDAGNKEGVENTSETKPLKDNHKNTDIVTASKPIDVTLLRPSSSHCELSKIDQPIQLSESLLGNPFVDMSDADNRLMFFKQLAAKRKAEKVSASAKGNTDEVVLKTPKTLKTTTVKIEQPTQKKRPNDPVAVASCEKEQSSVSTDSEKLELKKSQTQDPSLSDEPEPSLKESSSPDPSYAEQPASSKSASIPNSSESISLATSSNSKSTTLHNEEPAVQKPNAEGSDCSNKGETTLHKTANKQSKNDPVPMTSCEKEQSGVTTDSEKMELKKIQKQASTSTPDPSQSTVSSQPLKVPNLQEPSVKDGSQSPPSTIEHSPTNSTEQSANQLERLKHDSSLKESSSSNSSSAEQPASPTSVPLAFNVPSTPTPTESSPVANSSASQNTTTDPTPSLSQPLSTMSPSTTLESNSTENKTVDTREPAESLSPPSLDSSKTSSQTPEGATQSSPAKTVLSSNVETMKPESTSFPTEIPKTLESGDAESNTFSKAFSIPCEVEKESTTTLEEAVPLSPLSKQPKAPQSRYHSSTANVISSSNLRDDTKLLLGQISANSQNRNEPAKEQPVTDDDKESEADKNAIGKKDGGSKFKVRGSTKTAEEREVMLQKIQNMRKGSKVYSRFEMPP
ncbi:unnamed protein product [Lota lota]